MILPLLLQITLIVLPIALLVWLIRTVGNMAASLRDIAARLGEVESAIRHSSPPEPTNGR